MAKFKSVSDFINYKPKEQENKIKILIGFGTCGIAAGAARVMDTFKKELEKKDLYGISVEKTGCLGLCYSEPNVEVKVEGMPDVLYGKVDENFATKIVAEHIIERKIVNENIYDKPFIDIFKTVGEKSNG